MEWVPDRSLGALGYGGCLKPRVAPVQTREEQTSEQQSGLDSDCNWRQRVAVSHLRVLDQSYPRPD